MALHKFMDTFKPANPVSNKGANKSGTMGDFVTSNPMTPIDPAKFQGDTVTLVVPIKFPANDGTSGIK